MDNLTRVHLYTHPSEACDRIEQLETELRDARRAAVLLAYDMTPQGLRGMADKLASEINNDPDCWEMDVVGALRTVAVAFTAYEDWISSAKLQRDQTQAALTEARRVLGDVTAALVNAGWAPSHPLMRAIAAVLAQEEAK